MVTPSIDSFHLSTCRTAGELHVTILNVETGPSTCQLHRLCLFFLLDYGPINSGDYRLSTALILGANSGP
jgi:hypothetical protein